MVVNTTGCISMVVWFLSLWIMLHYEYYINSWNLETGLSAHCYTNIYMPHILTVVDILFPDIYIYIYVYEPHLICKLE